MKLNLFPLIVLSAFLFQCKSGKNEKPLIPKQSNEFVFVYKPAGDKFFGPDSENLKKGE